MLVTLKKETEMKRKEKKRKEKKRETDLKKKFMFTELCVCQSKGWQFGRAHYGATLTYVVPQRIGGNTTTNHP